MDWVQDVGWISILTGIVALVVVVVVALYIGTGEDEDEDEDDEFYGTFRDDDDGPPWS